MNKKEFDHRLIKLIKTYEYNVTFGTSFYNLGMDDLDIVELICLAEDIFSVEITKKEEECIYNKPFFSNLVSILRNKTCKI